LDGFVEVGGGGAEVDAGGGEVAVSDEFLYGRQSGVTAHCSRQHLGDDHIMSGMSLALYTAGWPIHMDECAPLSAISSS
jgi:hypothetical protein